MTNEVLRTLLILSATGAVLTIAVYALSPLARRFLPARWLKNEMCIRDSLHPVKRQDNRRHHILPVAERGIRRFHAEHHMRETQQRFRNRLLQFIRLYLIAHADDMARDAGNRLVRVIQKDFCIFVLSLIHI